MPKILALIANPINTPLLRLDEEVRYIRARLQSAPNFRFQQEGALRAEELLRVLEREKPDILHFAGHGALASKRQSAIVLADDHGEARPVSAAILEDVFRRLHRPPRCVFLNSCYSELQAQAICKTVGVVIGARGWLSDDLAILYSAAFYEWLGTSPSRNVLEAFETAKAQVTLAGADPSQFVIKGSRREQEKLHFYGTPEILAEFRLDRRGKPVEADTQNEEYSIHIWIRGAEDFATSVSYEICDESYEEDERYWEIHRRENRLFKTYDLKSYGELTLRAVIWSSEQGVGVTSTLTQALERHYGANPPKKIRDAIDTLSRY